MEQIYKDIPFLFLRGDEIMPKVREPKLYDEEVLKEYDYQKTKENVLEYFSKYRTYSKQLKNLINPLKSSLSDETMGIYNSKVSDPTYNQMSKILEYENYIESINKELKTLKLRLTSDEKVVLEYSILLKVTDEELARKLFLDKSNIYHRKKSCYIKVANFFHLAVFSDY